jgi:hypothetical protein
MMLYNLFTHTRKPLQPQLNNAHKKNESKMVSLEIFFLTNTSYKNAKKIESLSITPSLLSFSNPKEWDENWITLDECTFFPLPAFFQK